MTHKMRETEREIALYKNFTPPPLPAMRFAGQLCRRTNTRSRLFFFFLPELSLIFFWKRIFTFTFKKKKKKKNLILSESCFSKSRLSATCKSPLRKWRVCLNRGSNELSILSDRGICA